MTLFLSPHIHRLIALAIDEDQLGFDTTSQVFFKDASSRARLVAKEPMTLAGLQLVGAVFAQVDPAVTWTPQGHDGDTVEEGAEIGHLSGPATSMLGGERTALNFLQRACGIATLTKRYLDALAAPHIRLCDTRKTLPGYRELDKYAVRCGGGMNHRYGLSSGVMVKDNHIKAAGSLTKALELVAAHAPHTLRIEVETTTLKEVAEAIESGAEIIMLDNMDTATMAQASTLIRAASRAIWIEVSGNVTLERLPELGRLDVDVISSGALTHSIKAADISMRFD